MAAKRGKGARRLGRIIIFMLEIIVILVMLVVVMKVFKTTSDEEAAPNIAEFSEGVIQVNQEVEEDPVMQEISKGYWNIALFGVDARTSAELYKGSRSDSMMIASVNLDNGDIKLVSVYRDTYLNTGNDKYRKCNAAYSAGGAEQAINMLNANLDMNIKDFLTVNYQAVIDVVDGVGGVWIDVDSEELRHINNYQETISKDTMGGKAFTPVKETGYQLLNGLQATAYCRIRYTKGDDFMRAQRQREVVKAIEAQAKQCDFATLSNVFLKVLPNVYTTVKQEDMLNLIGKIADYKIVDEGGFPEEEMRTTGTIGQKGSCVIPLDLEKNVTWLHDFLFETENYDPSKEVKAYSKVIQSDTRPYIQ